GEEHPEHWGRVGHVLDRLPTSKPLEALSFRIHSIAFVCWTFTLIFGAVWAREAWGRYWGWDPKEVWTFIIWVIYAAYLHARATGGFRGTRAAWLALAGFVAVVFNYAIVNTVINGLHSYSGLCAPPLLGTLSRTACSSSEPVQDSSSGFRSGGEPGSGSSSSGSSTGLSWPA